MTSAHKTSRKKAVWTRLRRQLAPIGFSSAKNMAFTPHAVPLRNIHVFRRGEMVSGPVLNLHSYCMLWICCSGFGRLLVDGARLELTRGEAVLILPGQPHMRLPDEKERSVHWLLIRFETEEAGTLAHLRNIRFRLSAESLDLLSLLLAHYVRLKEEPNAENICGSALQLLLDLLPGSGVAPTIPLPPSEPGSAASYVRELCELLMQEPPVRDPFQLVASRWSVTPEYLRVVFRHQLGAPPRVFLNRKKLGLARHLLSNSDLSISEIALRCGFSGVYSFSRFFTRHGGLSPRAYRKNAKNGAEN
ncbi:MAG: helix-turn-helix transcriptional regulator [Lentisphaeria bacterium]|nr:helix-turn-helix transcriptional regulator [Lentisphaeria bacterium]